MFRIERMAGFLVSTHSRPKAAGSDQNHPPTFVLFQHTAARRRLVKAFWRIEPNKKFQHTAARRRLATPTLPIKMASSFNTQPPEGGWRPNIWNCWRRVVSTHSRPKAAGIRSRPPSPLRSSFNTQPPEGGWGQAWFASYRCACFNTQPPEGGWGFQPVKKG